jgi:hypothetical protein
LFFISIGSCVYLTDTTKSTRSRIFPEYVQMDSLLKQIEQDYVSYLDDPAIIRRNDSLSTIFHSVTRDQPEVAYDFAQMARKYDTSIGDKYINRLEGDRIRVLTIHAGDTTESFDPPPLIDTFSTFNAAFFDSSDFKGAKKSAEIVGALLRKVGAQGLTISSYEHPVSRNVFFSAVDSLWKIIRSAHKPNPMIIFYYCGHGYADGYGRRFLVPGTFTGELYKMPIEARRLRSVFVKDLYEYLQLSGYPFFMLLDCCSENQGTPPNDDINTYYEKYAVNMDFDELTRIMYKQQFHPTGEHTVIYSSVLGQNSLPVPDPKQPSSFTYVGPLCRRLLIAYSKYKNLFESFENLQKRIMAEQLDRMTSIPGIYCKYCPSILIP